MRGRFDHGRRSRLATRCGRQLSVAPRAANQRVACLAADRPRTTRSGVRSAGRDLRPRNAGVSLSSGPAATPRHRRGSSAAGTSVLSGSRAIRRRRPDRPRTGTLAPHGDIAASPRIIRGPDSPFCLARTLIVRAPGRGPEPSRGTGRGVGRGPESREVVGPQVLPPGAPRPKRRAVVRRAEPRPLRRHRAGGHRPALHVYRVVRHAHGVELRPGHRDSAARELGSRRMADGAGSSAKGRSAVRPRRRRDPGRSARTAGLCDGGAAT